MSNEVTKACNLTETEIKMLIMEIGREMNEDNIDETVDRVNYLNKRLKAFKENDKVEDKPAEAAPTSEAPADTPAPAATAWPSSNG